MKFKYLSLVVWVFCSSAFAQNFVENTDITDQVNAELKKNNFVSIPSGDYKVDANKSIQPPSGSTIKMQNGTRLFVIPSRHDSSRVFKISNVYNVKITGGQLIGDKYTHLSSKGEWGMGVEIRDSQNISISNMSINKMWGDAIYIGTNGKNSSYNINISNIYMDDNRRQGISIISVDTLDATNIKATNTKGTKPANGIDIEPNDGFMILKNINLNDIFTSGNAGAGIQIGLSRYNSIYHPVSINIQNHTDAYSKYGLLVGAVNKLSSGTVNMSFVNYNRSKMPSCFNSWSNNKFNINIRGEIGRSKDLRCMGYLKNNNISFSKK
ncbi:right-handed parallel beta-helix repeat-containing protein [Acinetobacter baumannii]|uniref:right-handed parallel beta-helix repeat-containing protein n=1 Tax=Acinetobacter baumannii TaxID=470 RepID=UPI003B4300A9